MRKRREGFAMKSALVAIAWLGVGATTVQAQSPTPPPTAAATAPAAASARPAPAERMDPRIRVLEFSPNQIYSIRGHLGYQMLIEFDPAERIENVAIGDSLAWQVTPNRAATMLFLKPVVAGAATNMTVITTLRRYSFDLRSLEPTGPSDQAIIYAVRFRYPAAPMLAPPPRVEVKPAPPQPLNSRYIVRGSRRFDGVRIFDDGAKTYFHFPADLESPAVFILGEGDEEGLVDTYSRPPFVVVDHLARGFVLRAGRQKARVMNEAFAPTPSITPAAQGQTP